MTDSATVDEITCSAHIINNRHQRVARVQLGPVGKLCDPAVGIDLAVSSLVPEAATGTGSAFRK